ncbi:MAG: hypothetical protein ACI8W7_000329 [Gammaproteobacteria bacterium]|jgi:hypothetical protein
MQWQILASFAAIYIALAIAGSPVVLTIAPTAARRMDGIGKQALRGST